MFFWCLQPDAFVNDQIFALFRLFCGVVRWGSCQVFRPLQAVARKKKSPATRMMTGPLERLYW